MEEEGGRRLSIRPGHSGNSELGRGASEELVRRDRHRAARVPDDELRHRQVEHTLDHERRSAPVYRLRREVVPVREGAGDAEKERPGRDGPRVIGEIAYLDRLGVDDVRRSERGDETLEVHRGSSV